MKSKDVSPKSTHQQIYSHVSVWISKRALICFIGDFTAHNDLEALLRRSIFKNNYNFKK